MLWYRSALLLLLNGLVALAVDDFSPAGVGGLSKTCECGEIEIIVDLAQYNQGDYLTEFANGDLSITATGKGQAFTPDGAARILDTSDPQLELGLGSPNQSCGGPGSGSAGAVGMDGENCAPQGNVMVIQENDNEIPDAADDGGSLLFTVDPDAKYRLNSVGFLDMPQGMNIDITTTNRYNGQSQVTTFVGAGPNAFQEVALLDIPIRWHSKFSIDMAGAGGISWFKFCVPEGAPTQSRFLRKGT